MSSTIGENGQVLEWREREVNGGSTRRELWDDKRRNPLVISPQRTLVEQSFESWLEQEQARLIAKERARVAQAMKRCPLIQFDQRGALLDIIFNKGES